MNLNEEIRRIQEIMGIDEMAYPVEFNMEEFKSIRSFNGKLRYAQQNLLGKVGRGSARAVFRVDDEKVIKVAMNQKGVAQNASEAEGYKQNYEAVARIFDTDVDDTWIEMELAKKLTPARFKQLTGTTPEELGKWLAYKTGYWNKKVKFDPKEAQDVEYLDDNEFAEEVLNFVTDYDYQAPGDFGRISSYGEVLRDGQPKVVIIDFGYDSDTDAVYMASQRKSLEKAQNRQYRNW